MTDQTRILLVEDGVITASSLKMGLEKAGYSVCPLATRGDRAIKIALAEKPDVILMDVNLAGSINGIETAKTILTTLQTKIIFLTGYHDDDVIAQIKALDPLGYIVKPVSVERVRDLLDKNF
jgi:DNA-binding NarL/FixJ family response regulator